eukprot:TRINITY_DN40112_c0_g1_i1.p1 TRINITY_DN40112_c0_g1~~TRINITY_DN40112_c0_g1_i1.p1  ORF type:complete len:409 (+),score=79.65 TRINITY_DN40112_c0_g1_i1:52-1278(+)
MAAQRASKRVLNEARAGGASSVWAEITALGRQPGMINLGQGFPDFPCNKAATRAAQQVLELGSHDQYSPIPGSARIQQALSALYRGMHPKSKALDPSSEVCVVTSGTEALYCAIMGLVDPGDEVVFFEPFFPWYLPHLRMAGAVPKAVRLVGPSFDLLSVETDLRSAFSPKTKMCIFNTPHNPTGHCATSADLELLASLCREHDALCLADEVYEGCMFKGTQHRRICEVEGMWDRTLSVGSASKLLAMTGWRVGWVTGPEDLVTAARTMHAYTTFCAPAPLQEAVAVALEAESSTLHFEDQGELMHGNWVLLAAALEGLGMKVCPAQGGYFLVADTSALAMDDMECCRWLAAECKVCAVPMRVFYSDEGIAAPTCYVRFAVCKDRQTIEKAVAALKAAPVTSKRQKLE